MRKIGLILVLAAAAFSGALSGKSTSEARNVSGFSGVTLATSGDLTIEQGSTESLTITSDDNLLPYLTSDVTGNKLTLGAKERTKLRGNIHYRLTAKNLNSIELTGSGSIDATGIHADRLTVMIAGSGSLSITGSADQQEVTVAGSGSYHGGDLKTKTATVNLMGSGNADLAVSDKLNVTINGSGSIKYSGDPVVTKALHGSGSIHKR
jgi:Putative auto-transporter adhesin, head GIN domain